MNGSTAFHLKQIMSAEHLSLTQTAKQIGISPASMRKVLKDATMSQAVMFKINRFIDDHQAIIATKPGELPKAPEATKEAKPAAKKPATKAKTPAKAAAKPAAKKADTKKTATKSTTKKATKAKANKPAAKANTKTTNAKSATPAVQTNLALTTTKQTSKPEQPKAKQTQAQADTKQNQPKAQANTKQSQANTKTKQTAKKEAPKAKAETKAEQPKQTAKAEQPQAKLSRRQKYNKNKAKHGFTIHQIDGEPIVPEAERQAEQNSKQQAPAKATNEHQAPAAKATNEHQAQATAKATNEHQAQANTHQAPTSEQQAVEERAAKLAEAGIGSMDPKPVTKQAQPQAKAAPAKPEQPKQAEKPQPAQQAQAKAEPAKKEQPKQAAKQEQPKAKAEQPQAKHEATAEPEQAKQAAQSQPEAEPVAAAAAEPAAQPQADSNDPRHKKTQTLQLFVDESFVHGNDYQRSMYIGVTVVDQDDAHALDQFSNTLYPFGWQPGDEVKARGKNHDQIAAMLTQAHGDHAANFVAFSPQSDTGNFALGFGVLYPYLATILRVLDQIDDLPNKIRIALDRRNELEDEQLAVAARMLNAYVKAQTGRDVMFMLRTSDSKSTIGIQYSDFSAHAALTFTKEQLAACGITRLPDLGSVVGDQITLFSMIGLQKYMLDDRSVVQQQASYKNPVLIAAERLFRLANKATGLTQVPDETLTQAKLVINQLLQITPSAVNGAINKMPFQTWYDMVARAAALLHYTDETLPNFDIDPDAMQIAQDALNNIANLLASAK